MHLPTYICLLSLQRGNKADRADKSNKIPLVMKFPRKRQSKTDNSPIIIISFKIVLSVKFVKLRKIAEIWKSRPSVRKSAFVFRERSSVGTRQASPTQRMGIIFVVGHIIRERSTATTQQQTIMDNISIISIPDSETSACGGVGALLNETYSPPKNQLPPVTPKREAVDTTLNATFTPEDNKTPKVQDETFSPVKEVVEKEEVKPVVNKRTPKKKLPEVTLSFDSPAPNPPNVPDILVVPPTAERRPLRRSVRTPAKNVEPVATRASTRISTRQQQTPLKTVPEKKRGRKAKKEEEEEVEEVEKKALETEVVETKAQQAKKDEEEDSKIKVSEDVKLPLIENDPVEEAKPAPPPVVVDDEEVPEKRQRMTVDEVVEPQPEAVKEEEENQESVSKVAETSTTEKQTPPPLIETSRSLLFETEQPTLLESSQVQPMDDTHEDNDDDDEEEVEGDDQPLEKTEEFRVPMFATDVLPKSIRKRSLSVADMNPPVAKRNFRVQFHSPGNMEKTITEIDESLYMNFTKSFASSFSIPATTTAAAAPPTTESAAKVKPLRRKRRSLSNAETPVDKLATLQFLSDRHQPKKVATTGSATKKIPTPSPRKKMPNFAAIHQSIFQQMESLVDFKERKKERAQFLLTSATTPTSEARANIVKPGRRRFTFVFSQIFKRSFLIAF